MTLTTVLRRLFALALVSGTLALGACQTTDLPYSVDGQLPTPVVVADASPERAALNEQVFDAAVSLIDRLYYDQRLVGRDWQALTARHRPEVLAQADEAGLYRSLGTMLDELDDRHTSATSPSARSLSDAIEREESTIGFGMTLIKEGDEVRVIRVRSEGAAVEAGVRIGWRVVSINGLKPRHNLVPSERRADAFVFRDEDDVDHAVTLTGRPVPPRPRREATRRDDGVEVLRFDGFDAASHDWMTEQLERLAADPPRAVIVDLRDNPGGRFDVLGDMVASFFADEVDFSVMLGRFIDRRFSTVRRPNAWTGPLAVLIGPGSGSASELFAAAIQDQMRGPVVGQKTAGAVIGSRTLNLPDGGELRVSTVAILTTKRVLLEKVGVTPDIATTPSLADLRAGRDPTLIAALAALDQPVEAAGSIRSQALPHKSSNTTTLP